MDQKELYLPFVVVITSRNLFCTCVKVLIVENAKNVLPNVRSRLWRQTTLEYFDLELLVGLGRNQRVEIVQ